MITLDQWMQLDPQEHQLKDAHGRLWDICEVTGGNMNHIMVKCPGHDWERMGMFSLNKGDEPAVYDREFGQVIELNHPTAAIVRKITQ